MQKLVDRWTLVHFAIWFAFGAAMVLLQFPIWAQWMTVASGAVVWEIVELTLERFDIITSRERWYDRWIGDLVTAFAGASVGMYWVT